MASATGTGYAGMYLDASNGDFSGSDYFSLRQLNDLSIEFESRASAGNTIFKSKGSTNLTMNGANSTFANNVTVGHDLKMPTNGEIDWNAGDVKLIGTSDDIKLQGGSLSITGDGSNAATLTESGSGDFTIAAVDDIRLDSGGNDIVLRGASSSEFGRLSNVSQTFIIKNITENKDIRFDGNDGNGTSGTNITALTLDMSDQGWAYFNTGIAVGNTSAISTFAGKLYVGQTSDYFGSNTNIQLNSGSSTKSVGIRSQILYLYSHGNNTTSKLIFGDGSANFGLFSNCLLYTSPSPRDS